MKILLASTPATGHLNPLLAIGRFLIDEGHEIAFLSGSALRSPIDRIGAKFYAFPAGADFDLRDFATVAPELKTIPPGLEWFRVALERVFVDAIPAQHEGIQQVLQDFPADIIIGDDMLFGVLPMLLGPRAKRPPIALCGTSFLHWRREDGAPNFAGLLPATTQAQRDDYSAVYREHDEHLYQPVGDRLNRSLQTMGVGPLSVPMFDSVVELADASLQLTVPSFEFPRAFPASVRFVGRPPIIQGQAPLPPWARELDGSRKVVLVTQGTLANHNFGLLVGPTLAALANEPDLPGPNSGQRAPCSISAVRVDTAQGRRIRDQRRLWQREPGDELWHSARHRWADGRQGRRERTGRVVGRRDRSGNQRAGAAGAARSRPHRARSSGLS
jgi:UDP:flavonoid glycosyltransferase YjiC (YdhE family)